MRTKYGANNIIKLKLRLDSQCLPVGDSILQTNREIVAYCELRVSSWALIIS